MIISSKSDVMWFPVEEEQERCSGRVCVCVGGGGFPCAKLKYCGYGIKGLYGIRRNQLNAGFVCKSYCSIVETESKQYPRPRYFR